MFDHKCLDSDDRSDLNINQLKSNENSIRFPMSPFFPLDLLKMMEPRADLDSSSKGLCLCVHVCVCLQRQDTDASASYKSKCFK